MAEMTYVVSGLCLPYHPGTCPALSADIQKVKTPEDSFAIAKVLQKSYALFNFFVKTWNANEEIDEKQDKKVYVDIPGYPANTVYLAIYNQYLYIYLPQLKEDGTEKTGYLKQYLQWDFPVTPHAFYCILRRTLQHLSIKLDSNVLESPELEQQFMLAPKLEELAETLIGEQIDESF